MSKGKTGPRPRPAEERFWEKVFPEPMSGCWLWDGHVNSRGYGLLPIGSRSDGSRSKVLAHRFSYVLHKGGIPDGLGVLHRCDNPYCVNPDHLFVGNQIVNMQDCKAKGRTAGPPKAHACPKGHVYDEINARIPKNGYGKICRACQREAQRKYRIRAALGTVARKQKKPRTHCANGHELTPNSAYHTPYGGITCRICTKASQAKYWTKVSKSNERPSDH